MTRLSLLLKRLASGLLVGLAIQPAGAWACAACYGQSDSAMAKGLNWGIFSLLAVVGIVLSGFASFFVYLGRKSTTLSTADGAEQLVSSNKI